MLTRDLLVITYVDNGAAMKYLCQRCMHYLCCAARSPSVVS
jgi:hypothetical protein